jgi:MFS family permease
MIFLGWTFASLFVPRISDLKGRRTILIITWAVNWLVVLGLALSKSLPFTFGLMFVLGMVSCSRCAVGFCMLMEFHPPAQQKILSALFQAGSGFAMITASIIAITTRKTVYISIFMLIVNMITLIALIVLIPESPKFLFANKRYYECRQVLAHMALKNNF